MDLQKALKSAQKAAAEARKILLKHFGNLSKVREKGAEGLVSEADIESESVISKLLNADFPGIPVMGEETAAQGPAAIPETGWIVDPLDGTTNYVHGFSIFCVSIGLRHEGQLKVGVVDVPLLNDTYWAVAGGGAFLNGRPIQVSTRSVIRDSLLATGFFPHVELEEQITIFSDLVREARGIRRAGAAAYDLCLVAQGVFDGFWEKNLKAWDTAAGVCIVREAGGRAVDYQGADYDVGGRSLLATNSGLEAELVRRLSQLSKRKT